MIKRKIIALSTIFSILIVNTAMAADPKSSPECIEQGNKLNDSFIEFSTQFAGDVALVSSVLFNGYAEISDGYSNLFGAVLFVSVGYIFFPGIIENAVTGVTN